jgi:hypothetical protein
LEKLTARSRSVSAPHVAAPPTFPIFLIFVAHPFPTKSLRLSIKAHCFGYCIAITIGYSLSLLNFLASIANPKSIPAYDCTHPEKLPDVDIPGNFLTGLQKQKQ